MKYPIFVFDKDALSIPSYNLCLYKDISSNIRRSRRLKKGLYPGLQRVEKRLAEKISEINLPFEDELVTIEED
ncbi:MAG: hypothetical protein WAK17_10030 [Candidatus Nitrosopolaris sp.]